MLTFKIRLAFQVEGINYPFRGRRWAERILIFCIPDFSALPIITLLVQEEKDEVEDRHKNQF